ncbi:hypothetical protein BGW42_003259, partial [Actinomortierella wolfii]
MAKIIQLVKDYSSTKNSIGFHASDSHKHYEQCDFYEPEDLIAMANYLLTTHENDDLAGTKALGRRFNILAAHHMVLRDQDIRSMEFSEMFHKVVSPRVVRGTTQCDLLVVRLTNGKSNYMTRNRYSAVARHKNVRRCTFGAFALYMFSMLHQGWDEQAWRNTRADSSSCSPGTGQQEPQQKEEDEEEHKEIVNRTDEDEEEYAYANDSAFGKDDDAYSVDSADDTHDVDNTSEGAHKVNDGYLKGDERLPRYISQALLE